MSVTSERYLYDWINRFVLRYGKEVDSSKTVADVLEETGFSYLIDYLEDNDIDKFLYYSSVNKNKFEKFIFDHANIIKQKEYKNENSAKAYFSKIIKDNKNILIVDIGWSGTGIIDLKYFLEKNFGDIVKNIYGVLMCTSRNEVLTNCVSDGTIMPYIYSPFNNMDLTRFMMPAKTPAKKMDLLHMPLEYLFTSIEPTLINYGYDANLNYSLNKPQNIYEIQQMQDGILKFIKLYKEYRDNYRNIAPITPYVAFNPLKEAIKHQDYCFNVYKNFAYDAFSTPFVKNTIHSKFEDLFEKRSLIIKQEKGRQKILFVTPELIYTGAPRSLLRMCKVAQNLGYEPVVWSAKPGPFIEEYNENGISVTVVAEKELHKKETIKLMKTYDMAICNTIVTNEYAKVLGRYMPVVWYIREATNVMDFCRNNLERLYFLKHSKDIYCVSEYAAKALNKYNKHGVKVIKNCVEDESDMALPYVPGSSEKIKFVQFGTMEYRKGYDVLIAAYEAMPKEYKKQAELYFAGGFINSGTPYCSYIFNKIDKNNSIHYLGVVKGEKNKIETLSKMDVIVVASRDESCSLVALEGAMLSKPLIVTENVGAKYIVTPNNGFIAKTGDVASLKECLMQMIDNKTNLAKMGNVSRIQYEKYASMDSYTQDLKELYKLSNEKRKIGFRIDVLKKRIRFSYKRRKLGEIIKKIHLKFLPKRRVKCIVSLTSHPARINTIHRCIESLLKQTVEPYKIILWLAKKQFPKKEEELPQNLLNLKSDLFEIRWTEDDLKPHKKYYYAMKEFSSYPIITVDDDVIYDEKLIEYLMNSYINFPKCISCMRANLMLFKSNGTLRSYDNWIYDYRLLRDIPSYQLLPTGVGGVLYPPQIFKDNLFDKESIINNALYCDDLWLKFNAVYNGVAVVVPQNVLAYKEIPNTQDVGLWKQNVFQNNNDESIRKILDYFYKNSMHKDILKTIQKDRFC